MAGGLGLGGTIHLERHLSLLTVLVPRISSMNTRDIRVLSRHYDDHVDPAWSEIASLVPLRTRDLSGGLVGIPMIACL